MSSERGIGTSAQPLAAVTLVFVLLATPAFSTQKKVLRFKLVNASARTLQEAYVSPTSDAKWGSNLIDQTPLAAGSSVVLDLAGACGLYDLRFVTQDGTELLQEEEDLCDEGAGTVDVVKVGTREISKKKPK